jgi:cell division protein FtsB
MPDRKKSAKQPLGFRVLMSAALALFAIFCTVSIISVQNSIVEKKKELAKLEENIEVLSAQNEELAELIASDDIGRYMEKLAVESGNYAYPDERRYYDTSRD